MIPLKEAAKITFQVTPVNDVITDTDIIDRHSFESVTVAAIGAFIGFTIARNAIKNAVPIKHIERTSSAILGAGVLSCLTIFWHTGNEVSIVSATFGLYAGGMIAAKTS